MIKTIYIILMFTFGISNDTFVICSTIKDMEEVASRIQYIIKSKGISNSEMADSINLPRPILSHILSGRNKPSLAVIQKITETYTDIDVKWLLTGQESVVTFKAKENENTNSTSAPTIDNIEEQYENKIGVANSIHEPKRISQPRRQVHNTEIVQIVHYFEDGTFKVFKPNE